VRPPGNADLFMASAEFSVNRQRNAPPFMTQPAATIAVSFSECRNVPQQAANFDGIDGATQQFRDFLV